MSQVLFLNVKKTVMFIARDYMLVYNESSCHASIWLQAIQLIEAIKQS